MARPFSKPLVVLTPKSMLHHKPCRSPLGDLAMGTNFQPVLVDFGNGPGHNPKGPSLHGRGKGYHRFGDAGSASRAVANHSSSSSITSAGGSTGTTSGGGGVDNKAHLAAKPRSPSSAQFGRQGADEVAALLSKAAIGVRRMADDPLLGPWVHVKALLVCSGKVRCAARGSQGSARASALSCSALSC